MEYKFKEGQVYEYTGKNGVVFNHGQLLEVKSNGDIGYVVSNTGTRWYEYDFTGNELKLLEHLPEQTTTTTPTPTPIPVLINVENLMEHIVTNKLESNEILSYLQGYVEGARF